MRYSEKWIEIINSILNGPKSWLILPIDYVFKDVDNHSFDTNSPELIQEVIDDGWIKPWDLVVRTDTED